MAVLENIEQPDITKNLTPEQQPDTNFDTVTGSKNDIDIPTREEITKKINTEEGLEPVYLAQHKDIVTEHHTVLAKSENEVCE